MSGIMLDIVTAERVVYSEEVDIIIAPGIEGELGILPGHTPLITMLQAGELKVKQAGQESSLAISGGFLEVRPDRVILLADTAERSEEIDLARAEEARHRAQERLNQRTADTDMARAEAALQRALIRLKIASNQRRL
ncbi:F0F1 ATP synthase subunit epsilon [Chloroflexota bacterium]